MRAAFTLPDGYRTHCARFIYVVEANVNVPVKYLHVFAPSCAAYLIFSLPLAFIKIDNSNEILANICRILYIDVFNINS